jgi:hypothetical protein
MQRFPAIAWTGDGQSCTHEELLRGMLNGCPLTSCDLTSPDATTLVRQCVCDSQATQPALFRVDIHIQAQIVPLTTWTFLYLVDLRFFMLIDFCFCLGGLVGTNLQCSHPSCVFI